MKYWTGDYIGSARCASRAREVAGDVQSAHPLLRGGGIDAMASVGLGDHEVALEKLDAMMEIARELGTAGAYLPNYQSVVFREVFDLDAARAASEAALEASRGPRVRDAAALRPLRSAPDGAARGRRRPRRRPTGRRSGRTRRTATGWTRWLVRGRLAVARAEIAAHAEPPEEAADWAAKAVELTAQTRRAKYEAQARVAPRSRARRHSAAATRRRGAAAAVGIADGLVNPAGRWHARAALAEPRRRR